MEKTIEISRAFKAQFDARSEKQRQLDVKKIRLLLDSPAHPSLNAHRIETVPGLWECYLNRGDRLLYDFEGGHLRLWQIGSHEIVDHVHAHQAQFSCEANFTPFSI